MYYVVRWNYELDVLIDIAANADLPTKEAEDILKHRTYKDVINKHWEFSYKTGVTGVPTYILNNNYLVGAQEESSFKKLFQKENIKRV